MRFFPLLLALIGLPHASAFADWRLTGRSDSASSYVDPATIQRAGNRAFMWSMSDYGEQQSWSGYNFRSSKSQSEFDCSGRRTRIILEYGYTNNMARGSVTYSVNEPREWRSISPGSVGEARYDVACGK